MNTFGILGEINNYNTMEDAVGEARGRDLKTTTIVTYDNNGDYMSMKHISVFDYLKNIADEDHPT